MGVLMGRVEIARTTDEMEVEKDVEMDAENGDGMEANTTDEMTNEKDAEILESETRVPPISEEVILHHLDSLRVRVTRTKSTGSYTARTRRGQSARPGEGIPPMDSR